MFCCLGFRNFVSFAGERGPAILAHEYSSGLIRFVLQSRGVAFHDEGKLKPIPIDIIINVSTIMGLRFCPFCGRNLETLVHDSPDFFKELAREHKKFLASTAGMS
jgi:hypothetical protein